MFDNRICLTGNVDRETFLRNKNNRLFSAQIYDSNIGNRLECGASYSFHEAES